MARSRRRASGNRSVSTRQQVERTPAYKKYMTVHVPVPVSVPVPARTVPYPYPRQRQKVRRTIRQPLKPWRSKYVIRKVRMRIPSKLPLTVASYVSLTNDRLNIHSARQTERLLRREYNRVRYQEHKSNRRKARNGQLDSVTGDRYGMIAEAARRGYSARRLADVALVSRALGGS